MKKWLMPVIATACVFVGFFVPFGISQVEAKQKDDINNKDFSYLNKISEKKNWKLSYLYSTDPGINDGKSSIKRHIRDVLKLDNNYEIAICDMSEDTNKNFNDLNQIDLGNPYNPELIFKFQLVIAYKGRAVFRNTIDNYWMLNDIIGNKKIDYLAAFNVATNDVSIGGDVIVDNINNFIATNKSTFDTLAISENIGDEYDISMLFSSIRANDFVLSSAAKTFYSKSAVATDLMNYIIDFPDQIKINNKNFMPGRHNQYKFFSSLKIDNNFFHNLLNLQRSDSEFKFETYQKEITPNTTIGELKNYLSKYLLQKIINDNPESDLGNFNGLENEIIFNMDFWKSNTESRPEYNQKFEDSRTVSNMWGFSGNGPWSWIGISGLKDSYSWLKPLFKFSGDYNERFEVNFSYSKGDNN